MSYWNTPERLGLLEGTCGLPEGAAPPEPETIYIKGKLRDALVRDHAAEWLGDEWGIGFLPAGGGKWHAYRVMAIVLGAGSRDEVIEAALRWVAEQKESKP